jgi:hypothetical protein
MQRKREMKSLYAAALHALETVGAQLSVLKESSKFDAVVVVKIQINVQASNSRCRNYREALLLPAICVSQSKRPYS